MTTSLCINLLRSMIAYPQYFTNDYFDLKVKQIRSIPLYILQVCLVYVGKKLRIRSCIKAASAWHHIFGHGSISSEIRLPQTWNVNNFTQKKRLKLVINLFLFKMCPKIIYKYMIKFYICILNFVKKLKLTQKTDYISLSDYYSW